MKFRKKPVVIEAYQWTGKTLSDRDEFVKDSGFPCWGLGALNNATGMIIPTLEGDHIAKTGDWIIKGVSGEYYPCKPDIFEKTYEKIID